MPHESDQGSGQTVTISEDSLGDHQCEVGDTLTFKVVSKDDGQIGLQMEGYGGGKEEAPTETESGTY